MRCIGNGYRNLAGVSSIKLSEDPGRDFPFYQGSPVALTSLQWLFLLALVAIAFVLLVAPISWPGGELGSFLPAALFSIIPLAGLAWVIKGHVGHLFGAVGWREIKLMILFSLLNIVVSLVVGGVVRAAFGATANPAVAMASKLPPGELLAFFLPKPQYSWLEKRF
jgi:uncharacterized protein